MVIAEIVKAAIETVINLSDLDRREIEAYVEFRWYDSGIEKSRKTDYKAKKNYDWSNRK